VRKLWKSNPFITIFTPGNFMNRTFSRGGILQIKKFSPNLLPKNPCVRTRSYRTAGLNFPEVKDDPCSCKREGTRFIPFKVTYFGTQKGSRPIHNFRKPMLP
jgi:hypothetical protein